MDENMNFVEWLEQMSGDKAVDIARRLDVSPTLLSLIRRGERQVSRKFADKVAAAYGIDMHMVYERAGLQYRPLEAKKEDEQIVHGADDARQKQDSRQLQEQLTRLRDYRAALAYSLEGRLSPQTIEKLQKMVALELQYAERKDSDAD